MSTDDDTDEFGEFFGRWLQSLSSGSGTFGKLLRLLGLGGSEESLVSRTLPVEPYISYDDIQNANTSYQLKASPLEKARKTLQAMQDGTFHFATGSVSRSSASAVITHKLEEGSDVVHEWLQRARLDASALDLTGKKSAAEMEAEIRDAPRLGHIARARRYFAAIISHGDYLESVGQGLGGSSDDPAVMAQLMRTELDKANLIARANGQKPIDFSALDSTGTKSSAQMQEEVHRHIVEGYVICARKELYLLKNSAEFADEDDNKVREWLDKANNAAKEFGFRQLASSVLDPTGKASAAEMNRDILKAIENRHFEQTSQVLYWSQHGGFGDPNTAAEDLRKELAAVNSAASALGQRQIDASALDPKGGKYRARDDRDFAEIAAGNIQAGIARFGKERAAADAAADQNEPALAALIRPLDTPSVPGAPEIKQK